MIGQTTKYKQTREDDAFYHNLYLIAHQKGMEAGTAKTPKMMIVRGFEDGKEVEYPVADGVCGFAWINIKPATCPFAHWLKRTKRVKDLAYGGGYNIWVHEFNQSMERKYAYARAFAEALRKADISATAQQRID